jgi:hypothetical protein
VFSAAHVSCLRAIAQNYGLSLHILKTKYPFPSKAEQVEKNENEKNDKGL